MKRINNYTIYCTEEQTKKALELGAPISTFGYGDLGDTEDEILKLNKQCVIERDEDNNIIVSFLPTAEQMIGWLRLEKGFRFRIMDFIDRTDWSITRDLFFRNGHSTISSTEATLVAIDTALDYLTTNKI